MRILSSDIQFATQHSAVSRSTKRETVTERIRPAETGASTDQAESGDRATLRSLAMAPALVAEARNQNAPLEGAASAAAAEGIDIGDLELTPEDRARIEMIIAAVERISGKRLKIVDPSEALKEAYEAPALEDLPAVERQAEAQQAVEAQEAAPQIRERRYHYRESSYEAESTTFDAKGTVVTADGQELAIDVSLTMSREFMREIEVDVVTEEALTDPLVINYEGPAASLTQRKFEFDIDTDGESEAIHFVAPGSGFLALDRNGDAQVNDGSELFGTRTGDGFSELARHDSDGNGFIDAGDPVYENLRIWSKDAQGNDQLAALGQHNVGAIYLGHASTPFEIKGEDNALQGAVRTSGVYLSEEGRAGTVQQVDLVV